MANPALRGRTALCAQNAAQIAPVSKFAHLWLKLRCHQTTRYYY